MDPLPMDSGTVEELVDFCIQSFGESKKQSYAWRSLAGTFRAVEKQKFLLRIYRNGESANNKYAFYE